MYYDYYYSTLGLQMYNVICTGSEVKLTDCVHSIGIDGSDEAIEMGCDTRSEFIKSVHFLVLFTVNDNYIIDNCSYYGDMQLVDGLTEAEGRVEICTDGRWATLCGKYWTEKNTVVVCRYFGFSDIIDGRLATSKALYT